MSAAKTPLLNIKVGTHRGNTLPCAPAPAKYWHSGQTCPGADSFLQEIPNSSLKLQKMNLSEYSTRASLGTFKGLDAVSFPRSPRGLKGCRGGQCSPGMVKAGILFHLATS